MTIDNAFAEELGINPHQDFSVAQYRGTCADLCSGLFNKGGSQSRESLCPILVPEKLKSKGTCSSFKAGKCNFLGRKWNFLSRKLSFFFGNWSFLPEELAEFLYYEALAALGV